MSNVVIPDSFMIRTRKSAAIEEWIMKEYGSWEDGDKNPNHPCAVLQKFGSNLLITPEQATDLISSGEYQSTSWNDDEIDGGANTKKMIAKYVAKIKDALDAHMKTRDIR